ncbi:MAG: SGNH/GDSL hydrolase family protein, partial [Chroococcales cyanobacterium]
NQTTPDSQPDSNPSVRVRFADGETEKTVPLPVSEQDRINLQNNFSILLNNPTGGANITQTNPVVVSSSQPEKPDSILFPDDNFSPTPEDEPADLSPDVATPTEETAADEPADLSPDVATPTEETAADEPADLSPDDTPEIEGENDPDLSPDDTPEIEDPEEDEPIDDETPPIEDEAGDDSSGEIEDDPIDENGGDESSGEDSEPGVIISYVDATSGIIADLSEGVVTRLFTTDDDVPFKILPLGDSNTRGFPNNAAIGGYRTRLWERLVEDHGFNIDFVGQANSGPEHIDRDHEGRGGFTIDHIIDNSSNFAGFNQPTAPLYTTIENALNYAQPDAVLLMAGTNDILQNKPVATALTDLGILVDRIVETIPNTQVLVSSIIPNSSNETRQQRTTEFSEQVEEIVVAPRANTHPNIRFVDLFNLPFVAEDYDKDGIHLKASGYDKLADEWYAQIRMLPSGEETLTDVQHIIGSAYDDTLIGDDQANILRGGEGNDWLIGGGGEDIFILAPGEGTNTIADFESGSDRIGLTDGLEFEQLVISAGSDGTQTQIAIGDTGESLAILLGIDDSMINADDFILV